jgi:hypothetical protein
MYNLTGYRVPPPPACPSLQKTQAWKKNKTIKKERKETKAKQLRVSDIRRRKRRGCSRIIEAKKLAFTKKLLFSEN